jgi:hypothetical protein
MAFAVSRAVSGGLLHALLAMVAGYILARGWQSARRWIWVVAAYVLAALLHASFDGSLLHLVFQGMGLGGTEGTATAQAGPSVAILGASAATLLILAVIGLWRSRRLTD